MTALIEIKRGLAGLPTRIPHGITILDIEIATACVHRHAVVAITGYTAELGILAETVTAYAVVNGVGAIVVDNYNELNVIQDICEKNNLEAFVLVRVNPCVAAHTYEAVQTAVPNSKFGFNVYGDALDFISQIEKKYKNVNFLGLHCHVGSQIYDASAYTQAIEIMTDFMVKLKDNGIECDILDFGGGFGIYYTNEDPKFTPKMYAEQLGRVCKLIRESLDRKSVV